MNKFFVESGFGDVLKKEVDKRNKVEKSVAELGLPNGASLIEINEKVKQLGYKEFSAKSLQHAAQHPGKVYEPGAKFVLQKK